MHVPQTPKTSLERQNVMEPVWCAHAWFVSTFNEKRQHQMSTPSRVCKTRKIAALNCTESSRHSGDTFMTYNVIQCKSRKSHESIAQWNMQQQQKANLWACSNSARSQFERKISQLLLPTRRRFDRPQSENPTMIQPCSEHETDTPQPVPSQKWKDLTFEMHFLWNFIWKQRFVRYPRIVCETSASTAAATF